MGWSEGANTWALLTLTLNMETGNSPKPGCCHTVEKPLNRVIANHMSSLRLKISVCIFDRLLCAVESENWHLVGRNAKTFNMSV
jgi:hypothetical protein